MKALVTGSTGFIGSHLSRQLVRNGGLVVGLTHSGNTYRIPDLLEEDDFTLVKADISDNDMMESVFTREGFDTVFHMAAILPSKKSPESMHDMFRANIVGTQNLLHQARIHGASSFVFASTMSVYTENPDNLPVKEDDDTNPATEYGKSKLECEKYCRHYMAGMNVAVLRYGGAYGPGMREDQAVYRFLKQALGGEDITLYGGGCQTTDFVYIDDVVEATINARGAKDTFNIGGGCETSVKELAEKILDITGSNSGITDAGCRTDRPFRFYMDVSKAREKLGYTPRTLREGLMEYVENLESD